MSWARATTDSVHQRRDEWSGVPDAAPGAAGRAVAGAEVFEDMKDTICGTVEFRI
jgi:hypothetical protein